MDKKNNEEHTPLEQLQQQYAELSTEEQEAFLTAVREPATGEPDTEEVATPVVSEKGTLRSQWSHELARIKERFTLPAVLGTTVIAILVALVWRYTFEEWYDTLDEWNSFYEFVVPVLTGAIGINLILLIRSGWYRSNVLALVSTLVYFGLVALSIYPAYAVEYDGIVYGTVIIGAVIWVGLMTMALRERDIMRMPLSLFSYAKKFVEVMLLTALFAIPLEALAATVTYLFDIIDLPIVEFTETYLFIAAATLAAGFALMVGYDEDEPVADQPAALNLSRVIAVFGAVLSIVVSAFFLVYILLLLPSRFGAILDTGETGMIFLTSATIIIAILFGCAEYAANRLSDNKTGTTGWATRLFNWAQVVLPVEGLILLAVAAYAFQQRIVQYGWTVSRVMAVALIVLMTIMLLTHLVHYLRTRTTSLWERASLFRLSTVLAVGGMLVVVLFFYSVDVSGWTAKDHITRNLDNTELASNYDRKYVNNGAPATYDYMVEVYSGASTITKMDMILTLASGYGSGGVVGIEGSLRPSFPYTYKAQGTLEELIELESDEQIKAFATDMLEYTKDIRTESQSRDNYSARYDAEEDRRVKCVEHVRAITGEDYIDNFCQDTYFYYWR